MIIAGNFATALGLLNDGYSLRREVWADKDEHIEKSQSDIFGPRLVRIYRDVAIYSTSIYQPTQQDIFAEDWIAVEPADVGGELGRVRIPNEDEPGE